MSLVGRSCRQLASLVGIGRPERGIGSSGRGSALRDRRVAATRGPSTGRRSRTAGKCVWLRQGDRRDHLPPTPNFASNWSKMKAAGDCPGRLPLRPPEGPSAVAQAKYLRQHGQGRPGGAIRWPPTGPRHRDDRRPELHRTVESWIQSFVAEIQIADRQAGDHLHLAQLLGQQRGELDEQRELPALDRQLRRLVPDHPGRLDDLHVLAILRLGHRLGRQRTASTSTSSTGRSTTLQKFTFP